MKNERRTLKIKGSLFMALSDGDRDVVVCQFNFNADWIKESFTCDFQFNFAC